MATISASITATAATAAQAATFRAATICLKILTQLFLQQLQTVIVVFFFYLIIIVTAPTIMVHFYFVTTATAAICVVIVVAADFFICSLFGSFDNIQFSNLLIVLPIEIGRVIVIVVIIFLP